MHDSESYPQSPSLPLADSPGPDDNTAVAADLGSRTRSGLRWKVLTQALGTVLQTVSSIVIARLLMPEDFGIVSMATMVSGVAYLLCNAGFGQALVQRRDVEKSHLVAAFWGSVLLGVCCAGALIAGAPLAGHFFHEPRMVPVLRALSVTLLISPWGVVPNALLQRRLDFRKPFLASFMASLAHSAVGIGMAVAGYGYWSLVGAAISSFIASVVTLCLTTGYLPPIIPDLRGARGLLGMGLGMTGTGLLSYAAGQVGYLICGRWLSASALGLYTRAYTLAQVPLQQLSSVLVPVLLPAFAHIQDDPARARAGLRQVLRGMSLLCFPLLGLLAVVAGNFTQIVFGAQWSGAAAPLQVMCLAGMLQAVIYPCATVARAFGRVYAEMWCQGVYTVSLTLLALIGVRWGIMGISWSVLAATGLLCVLLVLVVSRVTGFAGADCWTALREASWLTVIVVVAAALLQLALSRARAAEWLVLFGAGAGASLIGVVGLWLGPFGPARELLSILLPQALLMQRRGSVRDEGNPA